jgi:hypothetical protein
MKGFSIFVAGFMLGALFVGVWRGGSAVFPLPPSPLKGNSVQPLPESGAVSVVNQPAGSSVIIESVTVPQPGVWIAVREVNGADLGNVLGAVRVQGPRSTISVPLLRATEPGLPYAVELYRTDGGATFDLATNSVYVDFVTGAPVIERFMTTN